jgi:hypothetical protein
MVIARVQRELAANKTLNRMLSQAEAENIARFGLIAPSTPPLTLLALARIAISMGDSEEANNALTSWLVFSVDDLIDRPDYPKRNWSDMYSDLVGEVFPALPGFVIDIFDINWNATHRERDQR